jgi:hypothetical protein
MKQLVTAGVRVFFYLGDRERTFDTPIEKIMLSLTAFADELEREKARQRTYDAMVGLLYSKTSKCSKARLSKPRFFSQADGTANFS